MGHSNINITKEYLNLDIKDLQQNYQKFNPLEQMQKNKHFKMK